MPLDPIQRKASLDAVLSDFATYSQAIHPRRVLRRYQLAAALPILAAIEAGRGGLFVLLFSRQAGKDELLAQLQAYLLTRYQRAGGSIVFVSPTFSPQGQISWRRLSSRLENPLAADRFRADGHLLHVGAAYTAFLSAEPSANARGETASLALICNEAQDITCARADSAFFPMTASTNAVVIVSGTPWLAGSLLSRSTGLALDMQTAYAVPWQAVALELPAYRAHVESRIAQLGPQHPFIRTEYELCELDGDGGLFPPRRRALMRGGHIRQEAAEPGRIYAGCLDVAGGDEDAADDPVARSASKRDSSVLTIYEVDSATVADPLIAKPSYRVATRYEWLNVAAAALHPQLVKLCREVWRCRYVVADATGLGAPVASFLAQALRPHCEVIPFAFSQASKSQLGWDFLGVVESGRFAHYLDDGRPDTATWWQQVADCAYVVLDGPGRLMRWAVPAAKGHDDLLFSAALVAVLDALDWRPRRAVGHTRSV